MKKRTKLHKINDQSAITDHHNHKSHHKNLDTVLKTSSELEYYKFCLIIFSIFTLSAVHSSIVGMTIQQFLMSFIGVFFLVFSVFKLSSLKEFAYGFQSYDIIAKRSLIYSFSYPFIQLLLAFTYLLGSNNFAVDIFVILISLVSGIGVIQALKSGKKIHCVCLGSVIKLPLSINSFVEDFGMAIIASAMLLMF